MSSPPDLKPSFSTLALSIASSAAMAMGLAPNPSSGKIEKDLHLARFNIDLLLLLKEKTNKNLTEEELKYLNTVINDLQIKYVQNK